MKHLKRHWGITTMLAVCFVGGGALWWGRDAGRAAVAQAPGVYASLSETQRDAIRDVMEELSLDRDALVALNPSEELAESLVSTARTFCIDNAAALATRKGTIHQRVSAIRTLERDIRMGTAVQGADAALMQARLDLKTARDGYRGDLAALESGIGQLLSTRQQATLAAVRNGHGQTMPIRSLDLDDAQRRATSRAKRTFDRLRAGASSDEERAAAVAGWEFDLAGILTADQQAAMDNYVTNYNTASANVGSALGTVLPIDQG